MLIFFANIFQYSVCVVYVVVYLDSLGRWQQMAITERLQLPGCK